MFKIFKKSKTIATMSRIGNMRVLTRQGTITVVGVSHIEERGDCYLFSGKTPNGGGGALINKADFIYAIPE